ncbi:hypothetical protein FACS189481_1510 [Clostridia bacterium]|nr:hypothetical protein FACS189481_1510 [Clostridia bacterium]
MVTTAEVLECLEFVFRDNGFENIFKRELDLGEQGNKSVLIAASAVETNLRKADVIYSVCQVGGEDDEIGVFRFDIEVEGPRTTEHFSRLCEYVSMVAPYMPLGSIYVQKSEGDVKVHLGYDAVLSLKLTHADIKALLSLILSMLSCGLMLLAKRFYEVAVGNFEVLDDVDLFEQDLENLGSLRG